jgi:hypothetical protein
MPFSAGLATVDPTSTADNPTICPARGNVPQAAIAIRVTGTRSHIVVLYFFFMVVRAERLVMRTSWKEISKFLAGAFFVTAGASWYFWWQNISIPFPFFSFTSMTPEFLGLRGFLHFALFLICFYFGFIKK